jgi:ParB-like chromosome segregation protein Spo0J
LSIYGDPATEIDDLTTSIRVHGVLVPLVIAPAGEPGAWEVISGHRRLWSAIALGLTKVPCQVRGLPADTSRQLAVLEYNRQRRKIFSQLMREADALEEIWQAEATSRRLANLRGDRRVNAGLAGRADRLNSDTRMPDNGSPRDTENMTRDQRGSRGRTDTAIARQLGLGGKDLYRQARAVWRLAQAGDIRAQSGVVQLDAGTKTIHAAYKDLRRRDRFSANFQPTPYDVWSFRHDGAFGIPHPGAIPPAIIANTLYYYSLPNALVVDPMAGGGTTIDVCHSMGRRCLAYDVQPVREDIHAHDIRLGFPPDSAGCDLIFCDPPYHTMLADRYSPDGIATVPFSEWVSFLHNFARDAFGTLRIGGYLALLLAAQTEKDLPLGVGYLDHAFLAYVAAIRAGFVPERRISCPMAGAYLPQHVRRARSHRCLLGQVRDLLILRKSSPATENTAANILFMQHAQIANPQCDP